MKLIVWKMNLMVYNAKCKKRFNDFLHNVVSFKNYGYESKRLN